MEKITTEVLVVGGGTGGVAAAIQAARSGAKTILVSECAWLGGMLTSAGVAAPDGNELAAWSTGLWGQYLQELQARQNSSSNHSSLNNSWVSLTSYHPALGANILADWVAHEANLTWIKNYRPSAVDQKHNRISTVEFIAQAGSDDINHLMIAAQITIDATELGDLLAIAEVPSRWGWEAESKWQEPSLQAASPDFDLDALAKQYPVQAPTWVFLLQDFGEQDCKPIISAQQFGSVKPGLDRSHLSEHAQGAWQDYGRESFLNYGKLTNDFYMINWPIAGNDYGVNLNRLIESETASWQWHREAYEHSLNFASYLQSEFGDRYGLAEDVFPQVENNRLGTKIASGFALHPYYRESRRLKGLTTIIEQDILPLNGGVVAALPMNEAGQVEAIAIGNYANDHHYPGIDFKLEPKSLLWGGRWTGTPFTIPYSALVPAVTDNLLVCEKNISVSHIANGSTRLQPVVMNIGQAAGLAAALCIRQQFQPRDLAVRQLQESLLHDPVAPAAVIPLFDLTPDHSRWLYWQQYYLDHPENYPLDGNCLGGCSSLDTLNSRNYRGSFYQGIFHAQGEQSYSFTLLETSNSQSVNQFANQNGTQTQTWQLITIYPEVNQQLAELKTGQNISLIGSLNYAGNWLLVEKICA